MLIFMYKKLYDLILKDNNQYFSILLFTIKKGTSNDNTQRIYQTYFT